MNPLKVFFRIWSYKLGRNTRNNTRFLHAKIGNLIRQRVPGFDRRRKA